MYQKQTVNIQGVGGGHMQVKKPNLPSGPRPRYASTNAILARVKDQQNGQR